MGFINHLKNGFFPDFATTQNIIIYSMIQY